METATQNNQLTIIDKSIDVFKNGSAILRTNQERAGKAIAVGNNILAAIESTGGIADAELDERAMNYLANCSKAAKEMNEQRKPVTQLMDTIKKMFTEEENKLDASKADSIPGRIQQHRNAWAKKVAAEQERIRREAEAKAAKAKEEVELRAKIKSDINQALLTFLAKKKQSIVNAFNGITLDTFDDKALKLGVMNCRLDPAMVQSMIEDLPTPYSPRFDQSELDAITNAEREAYDIHAFLADYEQQISDLKRELVDKLPSKKQELEALAKADENERIRLENERLNREAAERQRLNDEAEAARKKAEEDAELARAAGTAQVLFDQVAETAVVTPAPEARSGYDIVVTHPAGWVEIFQFWFQREGCKMNADDMGKKSLNQMKTFAEGVAKKSGEKIESKYLVYETSIKSVNRKASAK